MLVVLVVPTHFYVSYVTCRLYCSLVCRCSSVDLFYFCTYIWVECETSHIT